ncbi:hypothetical protein CEXT_351511 [Caerostris extrusa]|uniref:Uncharacterized protein n=1 Tax=Caerostris extrusa TaxID=172846 RepID=A0AAV4XQR4_CAEEX|nr:hypothetical protein CEXT_351511 [Caerostris extrusa]
MDSKTAFKDHTPKRKTVPITANPSKKKIVVYDTILAHNCNLLPLMNKIQKLLGDCAPHNASPNKESQKSGTANLRACEDLLSINCRVEYLTNENLIKR